MIKIIKGLVRRFTTPTPNKKYISNETLYGEYEWKFISSCSIDTINNIILELDISHTSINEEILSLIENAQLVGLRILKYSFENKICLFFAGSTTNYISLLSINNSLIIIDNNKILKSMISLLQKIDIMHYELDNVLPSTSTYNIDTMYLPYITDTNTINCNNPITIQTIHTENIYSEILNTNYMDKFIYLMMIVIYDEKELHQYYISDFVNILNFYNIEKYQCYKNSFYSNFEIPGFKNIFDINLKVTDDKSIYDNIDEIID